MFFPIDNSESKYGVSGGILLPAFITKCGIFAVFNATFVNNAGVGFPSGDIGMESIHLHFP